MEVDSSSSDEEKINQPSTHQEVLALCTNIATYTFSYGIERRNVLDAQSSLGNNYFELGDRTHH